MKECITKSAVIAFILIYLTFFLDNVLLTVLVPIIPDWIQGESLQLWSQRRAPLASLLNSTVHRFTDSDTPEGASGGGGSQAVVGAVLSAKALCQLVTSPLAARAVLRRGPAPVLQAGTAALTLAALVFAGCGRWWGWRAAVCAGGGRALHGAGAALSAVSGLALTAAAVRPPLRDRALAALLGAVALGVLVGYPFGGATCGSWSRAAPFLLVAVALAFDLAMQLMSLTSDQFYKRADCGAVAVAGTGMSAGVRAPGAACAGAVLCTTSVMAALEPCLPLWIAHKFHSRRWEVGAAFVPDSMGYLVGASAAGAVAARVGPEHVALVGQAAVALAALAVPYASSVSALAAPHAVLGCGLGALDAALVPALMAREGARAPHAAALLQVAGSSAYALGPVVGGLVSWAVGFETAMRSLGVLNLLYGWYLYMVLRAHPLSEQWGASSISSRSSADEEAEMSD